MGEKHFCFFQTAETGNWTPSSSVKGPRPIHSKHVSAMHIRVSFVVTCDRNVIRRRSGNSHQPGNDDMKYLITLVKDWMCARLWYFCCDRRVIETSTGSGRVACGSLEFTAGQYKTDSRCLNTMPIFDVRDGWNYKTVAYKAYHPVVYIFLAMTMQHHNKM